MQDTFAFLIHPLTYEDIKRKLRLMGRLPKSVTYRLTRYSPPFIVSEVTGLSNERGPVKGWLIGIPYTPEQIFSYTEAYVLHKIIKAGRLAEKLGARILGLGAFTSVVGDAGITVSKHLNIAVTTGNIYTVATALQATEYASTLLGQNLAACNLAIIGATGSIGRACASYMAPRVNSLRLVGRDKHKLMHIKETLQQVNVKTFASIKVNQALADSDVVITATSAISDIINPKYFKPGALVCDVARPRDVAQIVAKRRPDVLVIEGGLVETPPGVSFNFNFGLKEGLSFACMAETMVLAASGRYEHFSLGREMDARKIALIADLAHDLGFKLAELRSFDRTVKPEHITRVRAALQRGRD